MSVDIDWSLLKDPLGESPSLADRLVESLNKQLNTTSRPSFLGPVTIASFDFGTQAPQVEIKDVRDVWRAFDEGDDEGDDILESKLVAEREAERERQLAEEHLREMEASREADVEAYDPMGYSPAPSRAGYRRAQVARGRHASAPGVLRVSRPPASSAAPSYNGSNLGRSAVGPGFAQIRSIQASAQGLPLAPESASSSAYRAYFQEEEEEGEDAAESVYSGLASARNSVTSVGLGLGASGASLGASLLGGRRGNRTMTNPLYGPSTPPRNRASGGPLARTHTHQTGNTQSMRAGYGYAAQRDSTDAVPLSGIATSPPASPPARPAGLESARNNPIPSAQLHLRIDHNADLSLTLLTSLQINYPSQLFMSLPLKLVITGMTFAADVVVAYSSNKHRMYVSIVDSEEPEDVDQGQDAASGASGANGVGAGPNGTGNGYRGMPTDAATTNSTNTPPDGSTLSSAPHLFPKPPTGPAHPHPHHPPAPPVPIGQRILKNLHIESDIGHADAHVLRNVGKVERFIVDVVRKTLVDELVFPNFHTVALGGSDR